MSKIVEVYTPEGVLTINNVSKIYWDFNNGAFAPTFVGSVASYSLKSAMLFVVKNKK